MERAEKYRYLRQKAAELVAEYPAEKRDDGSHGPRLSQYLHLLDLECEGELVTGDGSEARPLVPVLETDDGELWFGTGTADEVRQMPEELLSTVKQWMTMQERRGRRHGAAEAVRRAFD